MRPIPAGLRARLGDPVTRLALCWRVDRTDGARLGFTSHDRDLAIDGLAYRARGGFSASAATDPGDLSVGSFSAEGVLGLGGLDAADLAEGRFEDATVALFLVDWSAPDLGQVPLFVGSIGDVVNAQGRFQAELRSVAQALENPVGEAYSPECRADLGDKRCTIALRAWTVQGRVASAGGGGRDWFTWETPRPAGWADAGRVRFWTGANAGLAMDVATQAGARVELFMALPHAIAAGDRFEIQAGCDKRLVTCRTRFDNVENFRGEPFVPGIDALLEYPGRPPSSG
ncbi:putative phage protein (TIGR02218 family) [Rhodothalassium salexigens DSM 2132]|uniref:Putative phage protein (TIGR02218 family) n=1 Tax=Rhodothalassium salexigens DSM 2132 TaxID=1188247 RepID=A0A4R2PL76_RHOSA|nr:DUF2163 domain-containing protein [Rhodothalassium salexigens]MBB4211002.1 putative phage protein (TIGR02218 family) [Rhodothalassium salexigens DSM 2132]MBK1639716.1 hypothetical protein [Rhodothalassium salexigens DSM 2132]TCP36340.1 putative phage protein (TIGR02218 family) [Rhodothalassium salexigens DSM 2132]